MAAQLSCAAPQRERRGQFEGKGTYHLISAYKPCSFLKSWGKPTGGGLSAAYKGKKQWFADSKFYLLTQATSPIRLGRIWILPYPRNGIPVPHRIKITVARKKLLAQRRRREGVYNRTAEASVTFPGGADTRERADSPRTGGWSIADFASARAAAEFRY